MIRHLYFFLYLKSAYADPRSTVEVKLADYGISREVLPTGTRGFGGTPPFIAPEILQHAGKGTYTVKVRFDSLKYSGCSKMQNS